MAPSGNASFIPKNPGANKNRTRVTKRIYVLSYVSNVGFFSVLLVVIALYVYGSLVEKQLDEQKQALLEQQNRFSQEQLMEVRDLEKKMLMASDLLDRSMAPSQLFTALESVVSDQVAFTGAKVMTAQNDRVTYEFSGVARNFNDLIYQRDVLNNSQVLANSELLTYDYSLPDGSEESGQTNFAGNDPNIVFTFTRTMPGSEIAYVANTMPVESMSENNVEEVSENQLNEELPVEETVVEPVEQNLPEETNQTN